METKLLKLVKSKHEPTNGLVDHAHSTACDDLLNDQSVFDGEETHTFEDALEYLWSNETFADAVIIEFKRAAKKTDESVLSVVINDAVNAYVATFAEKLAKKNLSDSVQSHIENLADDENNVFRGRV